MCAWTLSGFAGTEPGTLLNFTYSTKSDAKNPVITKIIKKESSDPRERELEL